MFTTLTVLLVLASAGIVFCGAHLLVCAEEEGRYVRKLMIRDGIAFLAIGTVFFALSIAFLSV